MPSTHVVYIEAHLIDTRHGGWCSDCFLASVSEADVVMVFADNLRVIRRDTLRACSECGPA